jgi:HlyD family secretion protein
VSPQAEFTPGHVDRPIEEERLALRVKLRVPKEIVESNIEMVKTGLGAVGYVRVNESVQWPKWLQNLLTSPKELSQLGPPCNNAPKQ